MNDPTKNLAVAALGVFDLMSDSQLKKLLGDKPYPAPRIGVQPQSLIHLMEAVERAYPGAREEYLRQRKEGHA